MTNSRTHLDPLAKPQWNARAAPRDPVRVLQQLQAELDPTAGAEASKPSRLR
jgi:hypothetical protein